MIHKIKTPLVLLLFFLFTYLNSYCQTKKNNSKGYSFPYSLGVGFKLGDPLGFTIKKYFDDNALEFIIGRSYYWGSYDYGYYFHHGNRYNGYYYYDAYNFTNPIAVQLRYLKHKSINGIDGLRWYYGAGIQFRTSSYYYEYRDQYWNYYYSKVVDWGIGVDGVIGMEYTFKGVPITIGLDANLYMEIARHPFLFLGQGGLAIRYNF